MDSIFTVVLVIVVGWFVYHKFIPTKGINQIQTNELRKLMKEKQKYQFIDVRTSGEFQGNHIQGFKNIPVHELNKRFQELDQDKEVVVICQSGMRSNRAAKLLKKRGFTNITNVKGGMAAWV